MPSMRSPSRKRVALLSLALVSVALLAVPTSSRAASFTPIAKGDLIASLGNGQVNEYSPGGSFIQTLVPNANTPTGSAFDANGNLFITEFSSNDILKVNATTGAVSVFSNDSILGDGTRFDSPESIAFGPGYSRIYVSDANRFGPGGGIHVLDPGTGKGVGFYALPSSSGSLGVGESDWLALDSKATLYMTNESPAQGIMQVNQSTGDIRQPSFVSNLPDYGYALSFDLSGNLWLADTSKVLEYGPTGTLIRTITNPNFRLIFAAVFNPPYNRVYMGDLGSGTVYSYDTLGSLTGTFSTGSGIDGLSVAGTVLPGTGPSSDVSATGPCTRTLTGNIPGNVNASSGTTCLSSASVGGSVIVSAGAALSVAKSTIAGSLNTSGASALTVCESTVMGPVSVKGSKGFVLLGDGGDGTVSCARNSFQTRVTLNSNTAGLEVGGTAIGGSLDVSSNTTSGSPTEDGAIEIEGNQVAGLINCSGNASFPSDDGVLNTAAGRKGQCIALDGAGPGGALSAAPAQDEFVVCGDAPSSFIGPVAPYQTPCVSATAPPKTSSTVTSSAFAYSANGAITVAGRDAPPNTALQIQFVPANVSQPCTATFLTGQDVNILGQLTSDSIGDFASAGTLPLPANTPAGTAQVCVVQQPANPGGPPKAGETVMITIVAGSGPDGDCLQANVTPSGHTAGPFGSQFDGWIVRPPDSSTALGGIYAKITNYNPYIEPDGGSGAWTMLDRQNPDPTVVQLAQIGWAKSAFNFPPGTPPQQFIQYIDTVAGKNIFEAGLAGGSNPGATYAQNSKLGDAVIGDADYYTTLFDPTTPAGATGQFNFMVDNVLVDQLPGTFVPNEAQMFGEVHAGADQIPGAVKSPVHFFDAYVYYPAGLGAGAAWHSMDSLNVIPSTTLPYAGQSSSLPGAGKTVDIWDTSCQM